MKREQSSEKAAAMHSESSSGDCGNQESGEEKRKRSSSPENRDEVVSDIIVCVLCTHKIHDQTEGIGAEYGCLLEQYSASMRKLLNLPEETSEPLASTPVCIGCLHRIRKMHNVFVQIETLQCELNAIVEEIRICLAAEVENGVTNEAKQNEKLASILDCREGIRGNGLQVLVNTDLIAKGQSSDDIQIDSNDPEFSPVHFDECILDEIEPEEPPLTTRSEDNVQASTDLRNEIDSDVIPRIIQLKPSTRKSRYSSRHRDKKLTCDYLDPITNKCTLKFNNLLKLEAHLKSHRLRISIKKHVAPLLPRKEKRVIIKRNRKCPLPGCRQTFSMSPRNTFTFVSHVMSFHKKFICQRLDEDNAPCLSIFETEDMLQVHEKECKNMEDKQPAMWLVTPTEETETMKCAICQSKSVGRHKLAGHLVRHGYYVCLELNVAGQTCLSCFRSPSLLSSHFESHHPESKNSGKQMQFAEANFSLDSSHCNACCQGGLKTREDFMKHMETHGFFPCGNSSNESTFCKSYYPNQVLLDLHRFTCSKSSGIVSSTRRKTASCRFCNRGIFFSDRQEWINHIKHHNGLVCDYIDPVTQEACSNVEVSYVLMRSHRNLKHPAAEESEEIVQALNSIPDEDDCQAVACNYCGEEFSGRNREWTTHVGSHDAVICDVVDPESKQICREVFASETQLMMHCRKNHMKHNVFVTQFKCTKCEFTCQHHTRFVRHMKSHSGAVEICELCGKSCNSNASYKRHKALVHKEGLLFYCDICDKAYSTQNELRSHKKVEHEGERKVCNFCGDVFKDNGRLTIHVEKFHERKEFPCSDCGKVFFCRRDSLDHFKRVHTERKFSCSICGWSFRKQNVLNNHIQAVHNDVRQFVCDICGAAMKRKAHLEQHKLKHEAGEIIKPYMPRSRRVKEPPLPRVDETLEEKQIPQEIQELIA